MNTVEDLLHLSPIRFQEMTMSLYRALACEVLPKRIPGRHHLYVDITAKDGKKSLAECRIGLEDVSKEDVESFAALLKHEKAAEGAIITIGGVSEKARLAAKKKPIYLYDGKDFLGLWKNLHLSDTTPREQPPAEAQPVSVEPFVMDEVSEPARAEVIPPQEQAQGTEAAAEGGQVSFLDQIQTEAQKDMQARHTRDEIHRLFEGQTPLAPTPELPPRPAEEPALKTAPIYVPESMQPVSEEIPPEEEIVPIAEAPVVEPQAESQPAPQPAEAVIPAAEETANVEEPAAIEPPVAAEETAPAPEAVQATPPPESDNVIERLFGRDLVEEPASKTASEPVEPEEQIDFSIFTIPEPSHKDEPAELPQAEAPAPNAAAPETPALAEEAHPAAQPGVLPTRPEEWLPTEQDAPLIPVEVTEEEELESLPDWLRLPAYDQPAAEAAPAEEPKEEASPEVSPEPAPELAEELSAPTAAPEETAAADEAAQFLPEESAELPLFESAPVEMPAIEPAVETPAMQEPILEEIPLEAPVLQEPLIEDAPVEAPVLPEPQTEEPAAEAAVQPDLIEPAPAEAPSVEPVAEASVAPEPYIEAVVNEEPAIQEPAIEETIVEVPAAAEDMSPQGPIEPIGIASLFDAGLPEVSPLPEVQETAEEILSIEDIESNPSAEAPFEEPLPAPVMDLVLPELQPAETAASTPEPESIPAFHEKAFVVLNPEQTGGPAGGPDPENAAFAKAIERLDAGAPCLFVTGRAGTGKNLLLDHLLEESGKNIVVLASTAAGALAIEGQTIRSFFHFPDRFLTEEDIQENPDPRQKELFQLIDLLVIDEISAVNANLVDAVDQFMRLNGKDSEQAFGGAQVLLLGDLFHMVSSRLGIEITDLAGEPYRSPFFFDARVFQLMPIELIELRKDYDRHDEALKIVLNSVRVNALDVGQYDLLNHKYQPEFIPPAEVEYVTLTSNDALAAQINKDQLKQLRSPECLHIAEIEGEFMESAYPAEKELILRRGAQVVFLKDDHAKRWTRGSLGKVTSISESSIQVEIDTDGIPFTFRVEREIWQSYRYKADASSGKIEKELVGEFTQYPLAAGWAMAAQKSQGCRFDHAIIDLSGDEGEYGQLYTALCACKKLEGIVFKNKISPRYKANAGNRIQEIARLFCP